MLKKLGVVVYGGFSGSEQRFSQRDWEQYTTVFSGNIGERSMGTDNSYHVVIAADDAYPDGFTISDGYRSRGRGAPQGPLPGNSFKGPPPGNPPQHSQRDVTGTHNSQSGGWWIE